MHLNYLILAHNNLAQLDILINTLENDKTSFFIHIDKNVPAAKIKEFNFYKNSRVKIVKNRIAVSWAGFSMIQATVLLMKEAAAGKKKGYYVLLSGQDMPVKPNENIYSFLFDNYGKEYINFSPLPYDGWGMDGGIDRISYYWLIDKIGFNESYALYTLQKQHNIIRPFFKDFPPYGGSQWWCLTYECIEYVLRYIKFNRIIMEYFELTAFADEIFFQTIILNSPLSGQVVNDNLKYIVFEPGMPNPKLLTVEDVSLALQSNNCWARKFDFQNNISVYNELINHLRT